MTVNPPDGLQPASPNLAILQEKDLRIHAIVDSRTPRSRPGELTTQTQEFCQQQGECPATVQIERNHPLVAASADYSSARCSCCMASAAVHASSEHPALELFVVRVKHMTLTFR